MSTPKDPTDAPFIPAMGGGLSPDPSDIDSDMPGTPAAPPAREYKLEDPVTLARRLAAEAKAKREAEDVPEDPRALARRLAEQAKQKAAASAPAEDPRALARRLAEQAKQKAAASAPAEDPRALARRLAEQAKQKAAASKPAPAPVEEPRDFMSRVGKPRVSRRSATDILAEARKAEEQAKAVQKAKKAEKAEKAAEKAQVAVAEAQAAAAPAPPTAVDPERAIQAVLSGCTIIQLRRPTSTEVLKAVWSAHLVRAQASDDFELAVAASALLGALDRVGAEGLAAAEVRFAGTEHAVFVEVGTGALVAAARPAHVYLAGA